MHPVLYYSCKSSWNFSKKSKCNNILLRQKISFQALDEKGHQFLELLNDNNNMLEPIYSKDSSWLKYFEYSNLLYVRAIRAIVNYAFIKEY